MQIVDFHKREDTMMLEKIVIQYNQKEIYAYVQKIFYSFMCRPEYINI